MSNQEPPASEEGISILTFTVEPNYAGWRLDKYLCVKIKRASRTRVQEIIENDVVYAKASGGDGDGRQPSKLKASTPVWPGLTFQVRRRVRDEPTVPDADQIEIVFQDDDVLVVNKPAGLPIHPTARYHHNTLVEQLKKRFGADFRADPAHRLDRETSGLLVCGKTLQACQRLMKSFMDGAVDKQYVAIVEGQPPLPEFEVDAPIAEGTEAIRIAVRIDHAEGRAAKTRFVVEKKFERDGAKFAVLRCFPITGRQHQIRIHAQHAGFPLVGDKMYGPDPGFFDRFSKHQLEEEAWVKLRLKRQALHAAVIEFPHPVTRAAMKFELPLPKDMGDFVTASQ